MKSYEQIYTKALKWARDQKWMMPLGCALLVLMSATGMALCFISGFARLERA